MQRRLQPDNEEIGRTPFRRAESTTGRSPAPQVPEYVVQAGLNENAAIEAIIDGLGVKSVDAILDACMHALLSLICTIFFQ